MKTNRFHFFETIQVVRYIGLSLKFRCRWTDVSVCLKLRYLRKTFLLLYKTVQSSY